MESKRSKTVSLTWKHPEQDKFWTKISGTLLQPQLLGGRDRIIINVKSSSATQCNCGQPELSRP